MQNKKTLTEAKAVKALCHDANLIAEGFSSGVCSTDDLETASKILSDLADNIPIPETRKLFKKLTNTWHSLKKTKVDLNALRGQGYKITLWHGEADTLYKLTN